MSGIRHQFRASSSLSRVSENLVSEINAAAYTGVFEVLLLDLHDAMLCHYMLAVSAHPGSKKH